MTILQREVSLLPLKGFAIFPLLDESQAHFLGGITSADAAAVSDSTAKFEAVPFLLAYSAKLTSIGLSASGGGSAGARALAGVYGDTLDGRRPEYPGTLLVSSDELNTEAAAVVRTTGLSVVLPGNTWLWAVSRQNGILQVVHKLVFSSAHPWLGITPANNWVQQRTTKRVTTAYVASLPATFPAGGANFASSPPAVGATFATP